MYFRSEFKYQWLTSVKQPTKTFHLVSRWSNSFIVNSLELCDEYIASTSLQQ